MNRDTTQQQRKTTAEQNLQYKVDGRITNGIHNTQVLPMFEQLWRHQYGHATYNFIINRFNNN